MKRIEARGGEELRGEETRIEYRERKLQREEDTTYDATLKFGCHGPWDLLQSSNDTLRIQCGCKGAMRYLSALKCRDKKLTSKKEASGPSPGE